MQTSEFGHALIRYIEAWADAMEAQEAKESAEVARLRAEGWRFVTGGQESSWTEDGDGVTRCLVGIYDADTQETLFKGRVADYESEVPWEPRWYHVDRVSADLEGAVPDPEPGPEIPAPIADAIKDMCLELEPRGVRELLTRLADPRTPHRTAKDV